MIETCLSDALERRPRVGENVVLALCCSHYGYSRQIFEQVLGRKSAGLNHVVDPNARMAESLVHERAREGAGPGPVKIEVYSRTALPDEDVAALSGLLEARAPETVRALRDYRHEPDLFPFSRPSVLRRLLAAGGRALSRG